jgi:hypothetical protein
MIKDIPLRKVENLIIALAPRHPEEEDAEVFWDSYLINLNDEPIRSVIINATGYGELEGEQRRTSTLRHFWESIGPLEVQRIEPVQIALLGMANEYWVSFSYKNYLYDKKYVFVPGTLEEVYFTDIPFLDKRGVMIR